MSSSFFSFNSVKKKKSQTQVSHRFIQVYICTYSPFLEYVHVKTMYSDQTSATQAYYYWLHTCETSQGREMMQPPSPGSDLALPEKVCVSSNVQRHHIWNNWLDIRIEWWMFSWKKNTSTLIRSHHKPALLLPAALGDRFPWPHAAAFFSNNSNGMCGQFILWTLHPCCVDLPWHHAIINIFVPDGPEGLTNPWPN